MIKTHSRQLKIPYKYLILIYGTKTITEKFKKYILFQDPCKNRRDDN